MSDEQKREEQEEQKQRSGAGLFVKWALLVVIGLPVAWFAFCEARKAYWDWRVENWCETDGGIQVKRRVRLTETEREALTNDFGEFVIPLKTDAKHHHRLVREESSTYLKRSDPEVRRHETRIVDARAIDVIAIRTIYSRVGGDAIALHPSHHSCPSPIPPLFPSVVKGSEE